jgi:phenylpropionate dioxygenase-like ring-hydroxylating dioxygenase large terminal subunit
MERTLPREVYVGSEWFERERQRVFERQWFAVGRIEEIPEPGIISYVTWSGRVSSSPDSGMAGSPPT